MFPGGEIPQSDATTPFFGQPDSTQAHVSNTGFSGEAEDIGKRSWSEVDIQTLLKKCRDTHDGSIFNIKDIDGKTLLHFVLQQPLLDISLLQELVELGADPAIPDQCGLTALHHVARLDSADGDELLKHLVNNMKSTKNNSALDMKDGCEQTLLHMLLERQVQNVALIKELIELGANPTIPDSDGMTALHFLARLESQEAYALLLSVATELFANGKGDVFRQKGRYGQTVLHIALEHSSSGISLVKELLRLGADPIILDTWDMTVLHYLARIKSNEANEVLKDTARALHTQEKSNLLNLQDKHGRTLLHVLVKVLPLNRSLLEELLQYGIDPAIQDKLGMSVLHYLAQVKNKESYDLLLLYVKMKGKNLLNTKDVFGVTALQLLYSRAPVEMWVVQELFRMGVDFTIPDSKGSTLLHEIAKLGCVESREFLLTFARELQGSCEPMDEFQLRKLHELLNMQDGNGSALLHLLLQQVPIDFSTILELVRLGACSLLPNKKGEIPLFHLLDNRTEGREDRLGELLSCISDSDLIRAKDQNGCTALTILGARFPNLAQERVLKILSSRAVDIENYRQLIDVLIPREKAVKTMVLRVRESAAVTQKTCSETTSALEIALLLGEMSVSKAILEQMTEEQRIDGVRILFKRYPECSSFIVNLLFSVDTHHMHVGNIRVGLEIPDVPLRDVEDLSKLLLSERVSKVFTKGTVNGEEVTLERLNEMLMVFLKRVQEEAAFTGTSPAGSEGLKVYYHRIKKALTHVINYLELKSQDPCETINTCIELASVRTLCAGPYFERPITLYRQYCEPAYDTFENLLFSLLRERRDLCVKAMVAEESYIVDEQNVHADAYIRKKIGYEMQLSDVNAFENHDDRFEMSGFSNEFREQANKKEFLSQRFFKYYTPSVILEWMQAMMLPDTEIASAFFSWGQRHLKKEVGGLERRRLTDKKSELEKLQESLFKLFYQESPDQTEIAQLKSRISQVASEEYAPNRFFSSLQAVKNERADIVKFELLDRSGAIKPFAIVMMLKKLRVIQFAA